MKKIALPLFLSFVCLPLAPHARAQCTAATLSGAYGYHLIGYASASGFIFTQVGRFVADGGGKLTSVTDTVNVGINVFRNESNTGNYSVNSDCTGTIVLRSATLGALALDFVFVNGDTELLFSAGNPGDGTYGSARVQSAGICNLASLSGSYGFNIGGLGPFMSFVTESGRFVADGAGGLTQIVDTDSINGMLTRNQTNTGSYQMNSNCTGSLLLKSSTNRTVHYDFVLVNGMTELFFIGSDQATQRFLSTAKKQ